MKKLFMYYSLSGNGDFIANVLGSKRFEIRKLKSKFKYPKIQLLRILVGGYKATFNRKDKLVDFDKNIDGFDEIIIGSPIWNDRLCSPINTALEQIDLKGKNVTFILYSGTGKAKKAEEQIKKVCEAKIVHVKDPIIYTDELDKLYDCGILSRNDNKVKDVSKKIVEKIVETKDELKKFVEKKIEEKKENIEKKVENKEDSKKKVETKDELKKSIENKKDVNPKKNVDKDDSKKKVETKKVEQKSNNKNGGKFKNNSVKKKVDESK